MSYQNFRKWDVDEVSNWLGELHLSNLIPNFERQGITGAQLAVITDLELRERLRITKPAEIMALRGAINHLLESSHRTVSRKVSGGTGKFSSKERFDNDKRPKTLPRGNLQALPEKIVYRQPQLIVGSAQELLDANCKFSGWIRKQGGGIKSWRRRYLILRLGCLYYFANETANTQKGSFTLSGYSTEVCREPEIVKKCRHTLKLVPMNPHVRTYYIAVGSPRELDAWKKAIDDEIAAVSRPVGLGNNRQSVPNVLGVPNSGPADEGGFDEDDEEDDDPDNIYDKPDGEIDQDAHNYERPDGEAIYDTPEDDDEDSYTRIDDNFSPIHGLDGKPIVPMRSEVSLQEPSRQPKPKPRTKISQVSSPVQTELEPEDTYLAIIGSGPATDPVASAPDIRTEPQNRPPPPIDEGDYVDGDDVVESDGDTSDDDNDAYYIMFRKPEEIMPPSCVFDRLDRNEADRLLRGKYRDGTYLIRAGAHAGAEKVLSVWHIDRCRHYKLFKDENGCYSLTHGQIFKNIPDLLQHYTLQSHLPKSDFYLAEPYHPDDH